MERSQSLAKPRFARLVLRVPSRFSACLPRSTILPYFRFREALFVELWYSCCALNTAAVLCGPSGLHSDLRIPALRFLRSFSA
jgi:hypothetical protein